MNFHAMTCYSQLGLMRITVFIWYSNSRATLVFASHPKRILSGNVREKDVSAHFSNFAHRGSLCLQWEINNASYVNTQNMLGLKKKNSYAYVLTYNTSTPLAPYSVCIPVHSDKKQKTLHALNFW